MKILVIEPHADDAFLSLGGHIAHWVKQEEEVTIMTVYGDEKRMNEAKQYAVAVGAKWIGLGVPETGGGLTRGGKPGEVILPDSVLGFDTVCGPVGLQHPEHKAVAAALDVKLLLLRYLEIPYGYKQKNRKAVNRAICGGHIASFLQPNKRKMRHAPIFKTQSKFFFYNPTGALAVHPEILIEVPRWI